MDRDDVNPTANLAIALADGDQVEELDGSVPPLDQDWIPQVYAIHGLAETSRITGLSVARVRAILKEQGIPIRRPGRPRKTPRSADQA
ncbi:hypothetical protein [Symbiobacterium terraclitae]|uniref:hypothetical protein n=1 Tax=Symbiobacterium terraclitae TaxID=557451 RepID=UPI0035B53AFF